MHQIFKRVWPSSQRDTVFLSHIREIPLSDAGERVENEVGRPWIVCNNSMEHQDAPVLVVAEIFYVNYLKQLFSFCAPNYHQSFVHKVVYIYLL